MATKDKDIITFVVSYADGRTAELQISRWHIRSADHAARFIVGEKQRTGELPRGEIVNIKRKS